MNDEMLFEIFKRTQKEIVKLHKNLAGVPGFFIVDSKLSSIIIYIIQTVTRDDSKFKERTWIKREF